MTPDEIRDLAALLAAGVDPAGDVRHVLEHRVPGVILPLGGGMDERVAEKVDLLGRSTEARMLSEVARAAGIPRSVAAERWSNPDDVAWEFALRIVEAAEEMARCPTCGVNPDDVIEPDPPHRPLDGGRWKLYVGNCHICERRAALETGRDHEEDRRAGTFITLRPRAEWGEPVIDEG